MRPRIDRSLGRSNRTLAAALLAGMIFGGGSIAAARGGDPQGIHDAASRGDVAEIRRLLTTDPALRDARDDRGLTPLHIAAAQGRREAAEILLAAGAEIDAKDRNDQTPLLLSAWGGQAEMVRLLLDKGADPALSDAIGWTGLHASAFEGHLDCVRLLALPSLIELASRNGDRPLHWAINRGHLEIMRLLVEKGADSEAAGARGLKPLPLAVELGQTGIVDFLLDRGGDPLGTDPVHGRTLLHRAALRNKPDVAARLLDTGIDANAADRHGRTALDWAERLGYDEVGRRLLAAGLRAPERSPLDLTWISNAGFLVSSGGVKVLIDPVFDGIRDPETKAASRARFEAAEGPFRGIRLLIVTHYHADHLDPVLTGRFLAASPGTALFGSTKAALAYEANALPGTAARTAPRVAAATPALDRSLSVVAGGVKLEALHVLHEGESPETTEAENLAFLFEIGGWRVCDVGDIDARSRRRPDFEALRRLGDQGIDVALLPYVLIENPLGPEIVRDVLRPGLIVVTHYPEALAASLKETIRRLGDRLPPAIVFEQAMESRRIEPERSAAADAALPPRFDWRDSGIMTPVKHQMTMGSCGVFAAVAVMESLIKKATGRTVDLSEQQIINGSPDFAPSGISSVDAMKYIKIHGLALEERLPYIDRKTKDLPGGPPDHRLADYRPVYTNRLALAEKIETIKRALLDHGPVATNMVFYQDLDRYRQGVYLYDGKSEEQGGHWIVIVGWNDVPGVKNGGYWICRNSWGEKWGEDGYFNIAYGECGVDDFYFVYGVYRPGVDFQPA